LAKAENPININFKITVDGITPLMLACTSGNIEIVKLILANPTLFMDQRDNSGINSLYVSAYYGHFEVFQLLRQHGASY
jgi:ankyrin repeat protein